MTGVQTCALPISLAEDGSVVGPGDPLAQCRRVFVELAKTLEMAGATFADVVYMRAYVTRKSVLPVLREVSREIFGTNRPAFAPLIVPSVRAEGALVEVELTVVYGA